MKLSLIVSCRRAARLQQTSLLTRGIGRPWRSLAEERHVLLKFSLVDLDVLFADDLGHLGRGEAEAQNLESILRACPVGQLLLAVLDGEQVHVMGIVEAAHASGLAQVVGEHAVTRLRGCIDISVDLAVVLSGEQIRVERVVDVLDLLVAGEPVIVVLRHEALALGDQLVSQD